jgi:hypothetical protein
MQQPSHAATFPAVEGPSSRGPAEDRTAVPAAADRSDNGPAAPPATEADRPDFLLVLLRALSAWGV